MRTTNRLWHEVSDIAAQRFRSCPQCLRKRSALVLRVGQGITRGHCAALSRLWCALFVCCRVICVSLRALCAPWHAMADRVTHMLRMPRSCCEYVATCCDYVACGSRLRHGTFTKMTVGQCRTKFLTKSKFLLRIAARPRMFLPRSPIESRHSSNTVPMLDRIDTKQCVPMRNSKSCKCQTAFRFSVLVRNLT